MVPFMCPIASAAATSAATAATRRSTVSASAISLSSSSLLPARRRYYQHAQQQPAPPSRVGSSSATAQKRSASFFSGSPAGSSEASAAAAAAATIDPLRMIKTELASLRSSVARLLGSGHPALDTIAKYYFQAEGKHIRPQIVLLMARATNGLSPIWPQLLHRSRSESGIESAPISPNNILNDYNPHDFQHRQTIATPSTDLLPTQRRLAEITEMIHVASLLHDDVIDEASLRRSAPSAPASFGNKLSILAGDFLLGRASVALARLRDNEVVELLATVIANLVEGEVMQLKGAPSASSGSSSRSQDDEVKESLAAFEQAMHIPQESTSSSSSSSSSSSTEASPLSSFLTFDPLAATPSTRSPASSTSYPTGGPTREQFAHYLQKTYLKTASLIGKSARAATILGGCGVDAVDRFLGFLQNTKTSDAQVEQGKERCREIRDAAYWYGRNLGMAFQLVDDLLDFRTTSNMFGKPSGGADLQLGLATAPVLYAWQELGGKSGLGDMVARKFEGPGDVAKALSLVQNSQALQRTSWLAEHYAEQARQALQVLPPSDAKEALITLTRQVTSRMK